jgi:hypothetical protein
MMMDRFFIVRLKGYLKHAQVLVLEDDFVMFRRRDYSIQGRIPGRRV